MNNNNIVGNTNFFLTFFFLTLISNLVQAKPTIEDYGLLPKLRSVAVSPDGKHYAFLQRRGTSDVFVIVNAKSMQMVGGSNLGGWKARSTYFASNDYVVMRATKTDHEKGYKGRYERGVSFVYSISTGKIKTMLNKTEGLHPAQGGLGRIIGVNEKKKLAYMPAYADQRFAPKNLYKVSFKHGLGKIHEKGNQHTTDWFVDGEGEVIAREDYNDRDQLHRIFSYLAAGREIVYENKTPIKKINFSAVSQDEKHLIFTKRSTLHQLSLVDGTISKIASGVDGYEIDGINSDINRKLLAVSYSGLQPFDDVIDQSISGHYQSIEAAFPSSEISFISTAEDGKKLLVRVSGNDAAVSYMLYDTSVKSIAELGRRYPTIDKNQIGEITTVAYKARDGLKIPSILTWPVGVKTKEQKSKLPLIVLPHGGPASYDSIGFDWWAQYFANKGYLILQPNFRGSLAFGIEHEEQGDGKWGKEMQDDVSDGVKAMVKAGYADPERVCIMGASYGGYAALAGGVFTPELYRCVIAVGAVSDLPRMLNGEADRYGENHWVIRYWNKAIGDSKTERDKLKSVSPVNFADNVQSPILLVHGDKDTVVPISQSTVMHKALEKAGKNSTLVKLKGEDHWLSTSEARLKMLKAVDAFIEKHNPI